MNCWLIQVFVNGEWHLSSDLPLWKPTETAATTYLVGSAHGKSSHYRVAEYKCISPISVRQQLNEMFGKDAVDGAEKEARRPR